MSKKPQISRVLVTGGAGFIGSHLVRHLLGQQSEFNLVVLVNLDLLTYAGDRESLSDVEGDERYVFARGDICDASLVSELFKKYQFDCVFHLAAESHVDRSISEASPFVRTNVLGTQVLLEASLERFRADSHFRFVHVSTDEVFGALGPEGKFSEDSPYDPRSPYSASKASSDHLVKSYFHTYGLPVLVTNCSNNYGSHQFPEKLIPVVVNSCLSETEVPVYGAGENVRDWIHVGDHVRALEMVATHGNVGESYLFGGGSEWSNIDLVRQICLIMDELRPRNEGSHSDLICFVEDRPGHDYRYAIDYSKASDQLKWSPEVSFSAGLRDTVQWYAQNTDWIIRRREEM